MSENTSPNTSPIVLAFSGGLDTSFCVPWLRDEFGRDVITVTVNTGGIDTAEADRLAELSTALGAAEHRLIDRRARFFDDVLRFLIAGNVRRGNLYPLCVGAERGVQAATLAEVALDCGARTVAHGCTAAGNDQVRFEVALRTLAPDLEVLAPVRDNAWARDEQVAYLERNGYPVPASGAAYSVNRGLWGVTIGGRETLGSTASIPEAAWVLSAGAFDDPPAESRHRIGFECGVPVTLDGESLDPVSLIEALESLAGRYGVGRGIHLGDTVLGSKGRVAFEAPAAEVLITTHRELEKLVLGSVQQRLKDGLAQAYGDLIHEGQQLDLAARDIEAFFLSSQRRVTGEATFLLRPGHLFVSGVSSPWSLMAASQGAYGEAAGEWNAADARGFSTLRALPGLLQTRACESG